MNRIAIVGSGPMAIYLLKYLAASDEPFDISIFEASDIPGVGMPYNSTLNADYMLCNAFSREIPTLCRTLIDWLKDQPTRELSAWELSSHDLTPRAFYPRVLIGEYLHAQFVDLCEKARAAGHRVNIHCSSRVDDIVQDNQYGYCVHYQHKASAMIDRFDTVVIASGHSWPAVPEIDGVRLISPWPYTKITKLVQPEIGILGSSLSAIDIAIAIGHGRGAFEEFGDKVRWIPNDMNDALQITMVSHMGIMPEADFYYPFPYEPLKHITKDAVNMEISCGPEGLLERVFALLCAELDAADPQYLGGLPQTARTLEGFAAAYFSRRQELGGLRAVKENLVEARDSLLRKEIVAHRYALLRGHEVFEPVLRELSETDYARFLKHLMPVFGDCYAAVPHLSLARISALYDAGVLSLVATEDGASFSQSEDGGIEVSTEDGCARFDIVIDARGQSPAPVGELPFPNLVKSLRNSDKPVLAPFEIEQVYDHGGKVYCLALPQILERHPFSQGLAECSHHAETVANKIIGSVRPV